MKRLVSNFNWFILSGLFFITSFWANPSAAHVKWFTNYSYSTPPIAFAALNTIPFWSLLILSFVTLGLIVYLDRKLEKWPAFMRFNTYLESFQDRAPLILRIFTGASLLLAWQADSMIAPELKIHAESLGWFQFVLALLMLGSLTSAIGGLGMILLYFVAVGQYGFFHMLDYTVYPAIGYFLLVTASRSSKIRNTRVPALYAGLGFSLCWAALEKIFYPHWGLDAISQHPALTMGLDPEFFLLACAFVELSLGYLLIIGLLQRPLALTITLVFFTTTAFFGKTEVVGHTILHGALLVFIVIGPGGYYPPPIAMHRNLPLRIAFASVNFLVLLALLAVPYRYLAEREQAQHPVEAPVHHEDHHHHTH